MYICIFLKANLMGGRAAFISRVSDSRCARCIIRDSSLWLRITHAGISSTYHARSTSTHPLMTHLPITICRGEATSKWTLVHCLSNFQDFIDRHAGISSTYHARSTSTHPLMTHLPITTCRGEATSKWTLVHCLSNFQDFIEIYDEKRSFNGRKNLPRCL